MRRHQRASLNWHFSPPLNEISLGLLFHRREETRRANLAPSDAHLKTIIKKDPPFCKQCHGWKWHHHAVAQWCTGHFEPKKGAISCFFFEKILSSINSNHTKEFYHHFKRLSILLHLFDQNWLIHSILLLQLLPSLKTQCGPLQAWIGERKI